MTNNENQKPFDLLVEDFKANLFNTINTSGMPMSVIQLVVTNVSKEVSDQYTKHLQQLAAAEQSKEKPLDVVDQTASEEI